MLFLSLLALLHEGTEEAGFEGEATVFNKYVALREGVMLTDLEESCHVSRSPTSYGEGEG